MIPRNRLIWIPLVPAFILIAIFPRASARAQQATQVASPSPTVGTPTPTPFQPLPPTPTYITTAFPTPVPTDSQEAPVSHIRPINPEEFGPVNHPQDQVNILLMGSDQRLGEVGFRTDTIILLSINTRQLTASMVSFPRDLYLYLPGYTYNRINTAMYFGGFPLLVQTFEQHFGVRVDHYVLVGLDAFMETIDSLGGIAVEAGETLTDFRTGAGNYTVPKGEFLMDGPTALWYVRARYTTSDFDRTRRQQEVVVALANRLLSMNGVENADELYDIYHRNVSSNLKSLDLAPLVPVFARIGNPDNVQHY